MEVEHLFKELESNVCQQADDAKKKLVEIFNSHKEPWLVNGMLDYYTQNHSLRVVDVLVKVQYHHNFLFDKLCEWLKSNKPPKDKKQALTLLMYIVKKQPTWLHFIATHPLLKEIFKVLKNEQDIVNLISGLISIIMMLPIIPFSMVQYLQDLFDLFNDLTSLNSENFKATEEQLIHLQIIMNTLFQRLYGMYPCNFFTYLKKCMAEKPAVFAHTIKPMLENVKMHTLLITGNAEAELTKARWNDMEPHDVVAECAKLTMDGDQLLCTTECIQGNDNISVTHNNPIALMKFDTPIFKQSDMMKTSMGQSTDCAVEFYSPTLKVMEKEKNYLIPMPPTGTSPPETAVEATPETTPLKDIVKSKQFIVSTSTRRAIFSGSSQPSSPLKKDPSSHSIESSTFEQMTHISAKIQDLVQQRQLAESPRRSISIEVPVEEKSEKRDIPSAINSGTEPNDEPVASIIYSNTQEIRYGSPCNTGGLHLPTQQSLVDFTERLKQSKTAPNPEQLSSGSFDICQFKETTLNASSGSKSNGTNISAYITAPQPERPEICLYNSALYDVFLEGALIKTKLPESQISPMQLLKQYMQLQLTSEPTDNKTKHELITEIQLLCLELELERYRREVHAERNRRLFGKSRTIRSLELEKERLNHQLSELMRNNKSVNNELRETQKRAQTIESKYENELANLNIDYQQKINEIVQLKLKNENLTQELDEILKREKNLLTENCTIKAELFDLKNEMQQAKERVELGIQYKEEVTRLRAEILLMGEVQIKCKDRMYELENLKLKDMEIESSKIVGEKELKDLRASVGKKKAIVETLKTRIIDLEKQLSDKEHAIKSQEKIHKMTLEESEECLKAIEEKYSNQKRIIEKMEEKIIELYKNPIGNSSNQLDSEKTENFGSLDHTSPLSLSVASSDGLCASLRSNTEIKNLQQLLTSGTNEDSSLGSSNDLATAPIVVTATRQPQHSMDQSKNDME